MLFAEVIERRKVMRAEGTGPANSVAEVETSGDGRFWMNWTAEITNDPHKDYELYIELLEHDQFRGRLQHNSVGELEITFYGGQECVIPWEWLSGIATRFRDETRSIDK